MEVGGIAAEPALPTKHYLHTATCLTSRSVLQMAAVVAASQYCLHTRSCFQAAAVLQGNGGVVVKPSSACTHLPA